jgi:hypothetical protein
VDGKRSIPVVSKEAAVVQAERLFHGGDLTTEEFVEVRVQIASSPLPEKTLMLDVEIQGRHHRRPDATSEGLDILICRWFRFFPGRPEGSAVQ